MSLRKNMLRALGAIASTAALASSFAGWDAVPVNLGGGQALPEVAVSSATSKVYIPLVQTRALAVLDGATTQRLEISFRPGSVAYSAATGRLFVAGGLDNAMVAIDEATGMQTPIAVGTFPDNILVDDSRGKVYVSNWGGLAGQGSVTVIDSTSLVSRSVGVSGPITAMAQDTRTGTLFVTGETFVAALDAEGNLLGSQNAGYRTYSLAVDSRTGYVYVGALSGSAIGGAIVNRVVTVFGPGLQVAARIELPTAQNYSPLVFLVDPQEPGLYFASGEGSTLRRIDSHGGNLRTWDLALGTTTLQDGRVVANGIHALGADSASGRLLASSQTGNLFAEFDPLTSATEIVALPGTAGVAVASFLSDGRLLVSEPNGQVYVLKRAGQAALNPLARESKGRMLGPERGIRR